MTDTILTTKSTTPKNLSLLLSIMLILLVVGQSIAFYQLTSLVKSRQQASIKYLQQQSSSTQIKELLSKYESERTTINQALPSVDQIKPIVDKFNTRISTFTEPQLRFDTNAPVKSNDPFPFLPLTISLQSDSLDQISALLDDLTYGGIVYIPQDVDIAVRSDPQISYKAVIKGKLYVQSN